MKSWIPSRHPLRCDGGPLPVPYILMGKLLVIYVIFSRSPGASHTVAPILPWLEWVPAADAIRFALKLGIAFAACAVLFNIWFRPACLYLGSAALLIILWSRLNYSNNQVLVALLLILLGAAHAKNPGWGIRATVILVYFGAGLNKALDPEWLSGRFMTHLFAHRLDVLWYRVLAEPLGAEVLSRVLAWGTILTELLVAGLLFWPRTARYGVRLGLAFHLSMLIFTGGALSHLFMYLMPVAYLAFLSWPESEAVRCPTRPGLRRVLRWIDFGHQFRWEKSTNAAGCEWGHREEGTRSGLFAVAFAVTRLPACWLVLAVGYAGWIFL